MVETRVVIHRTRQESDVGEVVDRVQIGSTADAPITALTWVVTGCTRSVFARRFVATPTFVAGLESHELESAKK